QNGIPCTQWTSLEYMERENPVLNFNCRLICKQRVPGRVLPGPSYRVKNWSRLRPVARSSGWGQMIETSGRILDRHLTVPLEQSNRTTSANGRVRPRNRIGGAVEGIH